MPHRFVFVRHAQAVCNTLADDALIVSHDRESPLTESGRRQAQALAERMSPAKRPKRSRRRTACR
jgi:broad specificity phosphatase PhoE